MMSSEADTGFCERGRGRGLSWEWTFHNWTFIVGHIMGCMDKRPVDKMLVKKMLVKIVREDKMQTIFGTGRTKCQKHQNA